MLMHTEVPNSIPRTNSQLGRFIGRNFLKLFGWRVSGAFPDQSKFVAAVAPHTSNWDFIIAIAVKLSLGIEIKFLGKHTIFFWPLGVLLKKWGGIAVERSSKHGLVAQVADVFHQQDKLILGIAPEGTRKHIDEWKTGFLHIAYAANVPVVPMALDFRTKEFIVMPPVTLSGDIEADLALIKHQFPKAMAKYPSDVSG
ncbi:lysophospholipid acyltransferase family protein [Pseudoalteromonas sp. XMcav1-K]|uniref:lysophospholipid acyltransferase family protein n=1 Tax=Pseudoalteromonas sp. XMcav1-K TaxID=3374372 RepID=UPI003756F523